jgi:hypothetical protein
VPKFRPLIYQRHTNGHLEASALLVPSPIRWERVRVRALRPWVNGEEEAEQKPICAPCFENSYSGFGNLGRLRLTDRV